MPHDLLASLVADLERKHARRYRVPRVTLARFAEVDGEVAADGLPVGGGGVALLLEVLAQRHVQHRHHHVVHRRPLHLVLDVFHTAEGDLLGVRKRSRLGGLEDVLNLQAVGGILREDGPEGGEGGALHGGLQLCHDRWLDLPRSLHYTPRACSFDLGKWVLVQNRAQQLDHRESVPQRVVRVEDQDHPVPLDAIEHVPFPQRLRRILLQ
mmetsp:Transcript_55084/g.112623  ORF Transcript_55084/g.112623 Transcript_55084/m.112623 type:complete len:210 (-) Transcript_55084:433-1062(-)